MAGPTTTTNQRAAIVAEARRWIGTPYHAQAAMCGVGVDCSGIHQGLGRALGWDYPPLGEPHATILLSPDWAQHTTREVFYEAFCASGLVEPAPLDLLCSGDMLLFGFGQRPASHAAVCTVGGAEEWMVHAIRGRKVVEERLTSAWRERLRFVLRLREGESRE